MKLRNIEKTLRKLFAGRAGRATLLTICTLFGFFDQRDCQNMFLLGGTPVKRLRSNLKKRISISRKLLKLTYRICDGTATNFDLRAIVEACSESGWNKCWDSQCKYLDRGDGKIDNFECELLKKREFEKLADPSDARCTIALLGPLCDFYLKKYERKRITYVRPDRLKDSTPTIVPDYAGILRRCKTTDWIYGNQPKKWYYFLCRCAFNEAYNAAGRTRRCGICAHFQPRNKFCVSKNRDVKAHSKVCEDDYVPIVIPQSFWA